MQIAERLVEPDEESVENKTLPKRTERILDLNPNLKRKVDGLGCHPRTIQNAVKRALAQTDVDAKPRSVMRQKRVTPHQKRGKEELPGEDEEILKGEGRLTFHVNHLKAEC
jgi:hypothetical protein